MIWIRSNSKLLVQMRSRSAASGRFEIDEMPLRAVSWVLGSAIAGSIVSFIVAFCKRA